jgi:hypothetical protein
MPYILVRGNLAAYGQRYPWRVLVSGLKAADIEQLNRFSSGGYCDDCTIVYMQHPCVILTALEVLGVQSGRLVVHLRQTGLQRIHVDDAQGLCRTGASRL